MCTIDLALIPSRMSHKLSPLSIVGLSLALVAMVFHMVGLATPSWVDVQMQFPGVGAITISYGLWVQCHDPGTCEHLSVDYLLHWRESHPHPHSISIVSR